jgi:hypothetical protein
MPGYAINLTRAACLRGVSAGIAIAAGGLEINPSEPVENNP